MLPRTVEIMSRRLSVASIIGLPRLRLATAAWLALALADSVAAASGEVIYRAKCSACHDSGEGHAPRIGVAADWATRFAQGRAAMRAAAIKGVPNTAMAAKGGFAELTDAEVIAAVDHMLARTGYTEPSPAAAARRSAAATGAKPLPMRANREGGDQGISKEVAEALRESLAPPGAMIERVESELLVRGIGIRVGTRDGVVTLMGVVERGEMVQRAEALARSVEGVRGVTNRLVTGGMLDFD